MSVRRSKQFACVHLLTKTRLESADQFDAEVRGWLKQAYDAT